MTGQDTTEFGILGPLEVSERGQPLDIGSGKQRALLAVLLLRTGEVVSTDHLIDVLWGERPPASALNSIHVYVSQLRKALGNGRLETRGRGYRLAVAPDRTDLGRFERALREGRDLLAAGDAERASAALHSALALWRGPALSDFASEPFARDEIARLEELRLAALEDRFDADLLLGRHAELVPELEQLIRAHPLRERLRAQLMLALYRSGRQSEALDAYQQARRMLTLELGLEPSRTLQDLERAILRHDPALEAPPRADAPPGRRRRKSAVLIVAAGVLLVSTAIAATRVGLPAGPPTVVGNSVIRIDPTTLKPTDVFPVGDAPDLVVSAGGFVWVTHHVLRDTDSGAIRDAGDRTLTRVDPATGSVVVVGGGLAPCGLAPDPSGDVWVANCFAAGPRGATVVRIDATTLDFKATWSVPAGDGFYRGLAYGGGSLWVAEVAGGYDPPARHSVTQIDPDSGSQRSIEVEMPASPIAWSEAYGDLWLSNFDFGSVSRLHGRTHVVKTIAGVAASPAFPVVDGDTVWVADWSGPRVVRLEADGSNEAPHSVSLPVEQDAGVWSVAAGAGAVWATTPRDGTLWKIDPKTNDVTRIAVPYLPTGVAADENDVWVTVRG